VCKILLLPLLVLVILGQSIAGFHQTLFFCAKERPSFYPRLLLQVAGTARLGKAVTVKASFKNPLSTPLEGGVFRFEGAGLRELVEKKVGRVSVFAAVG